MNRTTALIIALAILLAHTLAIHKSGNGLIAEPYDFAYVAYRIARNFVHTGAFAWDPSFGPADSYPSLLWIGVAAIAERAYIAVGWFCQLVGLFAALACVLVVARFSADRLAGVIAPLLFVVSGGIAAAALSGLETSTLTLLLTASFLSYERGRRVPLALGLTLACLTRPHALVFTLCLLAIELVRLVRGRRRASGVARPTLLPAFIAPIVAALAVAFVRRATSGEFLSNWTDALLAPRPRVLREGLAYLRDFVVASGGPALFVFPLWYLLRGVLSGVGVRACALTLSWCAAIGLGGGGSLPFFEALTPILAVLFVAVQEAMQISLDSRRPGLPQLTWVMFVLGLTSSTLVSKFPGDLGPIPVEPWHRQWMQAHTKPRFGYEGSLGRIGLAEEIRSTERLREIGIFLREHLDPSHTVLTPWPGAIAYLSRLRVIDALGRTTPAPGQQRTRSWDGLPRTDVVEVLRLRPDYIVPTITFGDEAPSAQTIAVDWAKSLDVHPEMPKRSGEIASTLRTYELITVPIIGPFGRQGVFPRNRFYLMRRSELGLAPKLEARRDGDLVAIEVEHRSHAQLADLRVQLIDRTGGVWCMRPTGEFVKRNETLARTSVLLHATGERRIRLVDVRLPADVAAIELRAVLRNPGASGENLFAAASTELVLRLR